MKLLLKSISNQPIFIGTGLILILLILTTQYQFWFGDYSRSDLEKIKEEISVVEKEIEIIKENNQELIDEKEKLNSGKDAIEGIARIELGMIKPGEKFFGRSKVCMRQRVGCAVCARVCWIESAFPCFLFREWRGDGAEEDAEGTNSESNNSSDCCEPGSDTEQPHSMRKAKKLLRDEEGYYVANAHRINELLDVKKYSEAWPRIPQEELHASSVQHPKYPEYRWLLNTRRVPVMATQYDACDSELPKCAGVGIEDEVVWLCKICTRALCTAVPSMPFFALAN